VVAGTISFLFEGLVPSVPVGTSWYKASAQYWESSQDTNLETRLVTRLATRLAWRNKVGDHLVPSWY